MVKAYLKGDLLLLPPVMIAMAIISFTTYKINSSISMNNIARTCMKCHAEIEQVHTKVIKRELWEKEPGAIPSCTDCHPPHKVNSEYSYDMSDACLKCHEEDDVHKVVE